jgi:hypothetical protein
MAHPSFARSSNENHISRCFGRDHLAHHGLRPWRRSRICEYMPIPTPKTSLILIAFCPVRSRFLEATFSGQSESWPDRAPGTVDRLVVKVERREAPRLRHWARAAGVISCARRGRCSVLRVPRKHPGASRRSIASRGWRGNWQTSDASRRENAEAWLFES